MKKRKYYFGKNKFKKSRNHFSKLPSLVRDMFIREMVTEVEKSLTIRVKENPFYSN